MKSRTLSILLVVIVILSAGIFHGNSRVHSSKAAVSEQLPGNENAVKEKAPKNDLMIWESLSSHLLSIN